MCCILCEEPVRSITLGLAAVGLVSLINGTRRILKHPGVASCADQAHPGAPVSVALEVESAT